MQIGFNNEIEFEGSRYHIQTEDHGLDDGRITSQIFRGGQIVETMTISYLKAIASIEAPEKRDEEIRKRMKALHGLCFRNIRSGKYAEPSAKQPEPEPAEARRTMPPPPPSQIIRPATQPPDTKPGAARAKAAPVDVVTVNDEAEDREPTLEMDSPDLELPPELADAVESSILPDELEGSIEIEELRLDQLSDAGLVPVDEEDAISDPSQTHVDSNIDLSTRYMTSPSGVVYDRAVRAFRGIDTADDDSLLILLRELVQARQLRL